MQKFVTEIFKVKTGWSQELINDIFKFIESLYSLRKISQVQAEDPNIKI